MKITGGRFLNRDIKCPPGIIRPAMSRMRESLFSSLGDIEGSSFLDLFSGSALMALEANSRGAHPVVAVEGDRGKATIFFQNIKTVQSDVKGVISRVEGYLKRVSESFDIIYLDPPFNYEDKNALLKRVVDSLACHSETVILIHFPSKENLLEELPNGFSVSKVKKYGNSKVHFYTKAC